MKRSDIFTLILIAGIGTLAAFFVCNAILGDPDKASVSFTALRDVVSSSLDQPDPEIFNSYAINPTVEVYVGDCEDIDRNGILDTAELIVCGKAAPESLPTGEDATVEELTRIRETDGCIATPEGTTLCGDDKKSYIDEVIAGMNNTENQKE